MHFTVSEITFCAVSDDCEAATKLRHGGILSQIRHITNYSLPMIIGVDAGMLGITDDRLKVGVWRVAVNLLTELSKQDRINRYYLYSFAPIPKELMRQFGSRMENRVLRPSKGWFTVRLPIELTLQPVDIFLGLAQALPSCAAHRIGFVYDLGFIGEARAYPDSQERLLRQTQQLVSRADHIVAISDAVKDDLFNICRFPQRRITVAHPGFDERFASGGKSYKGKNPYFLFVGALKRGKNVPMLLRGFAQFLQLAKTPYDLYLVGGDLWLDPEIPSTLKAFHLEKRVKQLGFVADDKLPALYRGAVAFVSPSLAEGFCLPVVEAMACGCPAIISDTPVMHEIAGGTAIFVDPTSEQAIADALAHLVKDATLRSKLRRQGPIRAKRYSWQRMAKQVLSLMYET